MIRQFEELASWLGFTIRPAAAMINGLWVTRPDVLSVRYGGHHVMTIPSKMYAFRNYKYRTLDGIEQPSFYECEHKLRSWDAIVRKTQYISERDKKERELIRMEKNYV